MSTLCCGRQGTREVQETRGCDNSLRDEHSQGVTYIGIHNARRIAILERI